MIGPRSAAVLVAVVTLSACRSSSGTGGSASGVRGAVAIGPACPAAGQQSPCADRPLATVVSFFDRSGKLTATVRSGGDGTFTLNLAPGTYSVKASPQIGLPPGRTLPASVTVPRQGFATVTLRVDSRTG